MEIRPIRTDEDHRAALAAIEACWGAPEGTEDGDRLDVLLALVDIYEARSMRQGVGRSKPTAISIRSMCSAMPLTNSATPGPSWRNCWDRARAPRKFSRAGVRSPSR